MRWQFYYLPVLLAISTVKAEDKPCTIHHGGKYYDLSPLKARKDYEFKSLGGNHDFVINVCRAVAHETWNLKTENPSEVGGFVRKDHSDFSIGKFNTSLVMKDVRLQLIYSEGSLCKSNDNLRASTMIEFICDTSIFAAGRPRLVAQFPQEDDLACGFFIEWKTHFACPTSEPGSTWGFLAILAILLTIALMTYIVLGTLYNRYVLHLKGFDQFPQFSLTSTVYHVRSAAEWLRDTVEGRLRTNTFSPISQQADHGIGEDQGGSFQRAGPQTGRGRDINPVSHQSQVGLNSRSRSVGVQQQQKPTNAGLGNAQTGQLGQRPLPQDESREMFMNGHGG